jgi:hypothetical protein
MRNRVEQDRKVTLVQILDVCPCDPDPERVAGFHIDQPKRGDSNDVFAIRIAGWVVGRVSPAIAIELVHEDIAVRRYPVCMRRRDVVARHSEFAGFERCGFWITMGTLALDLEFVLRIEAVFQDESHATLAIIHGRQQPLTSAFEPKLQPLLITSMGRTGTTLLMRLLTEHPQVVGHRVYPYEMRAHSYWMQMLQVLSEPSDYFFRPHINDFLPQVAKIGHHPAYYYPPAGNPAGPDQGPLNKWFGRAYTEHLAAFCQQSAEDFYWEVARSHGQVNPLFFAEKQIPESVHIRRFIRVLYPRSREIFLFRDFKDTFCSIAAFNAKRGYMAFGRDKVESDQEFIRRLRLGGLRLLREWKSRHASSHRLRYEDLITSPLKSLENILEYLGVDASHSTIKGMVRRASDETPELREHRTIPDAEMSIGRWRTDLDESLRGVCDEVLGDLQRELGYE